MHGLASVLIAVDDHPPGLGRFFGALIEQTAEMTTVAEDFFYIGNAFLKREFLLKTSLFDEHFPYHTLDDYEIGVRMRERGMRAVFLPDAKADHVHRITLVGRSRAMYQTGESAVWFDHKYPERQWWD